MVVTGAAVVVAAASVVAATVVMGAAVVVAGVFVVVAGAAVVVAAASVVAAMVVMGAAVVVAGVAGASVVAGAPAVVGAESAGIPGVRPYCTGMCCWAHAKHSRLACCCDHGWPCHRFGRWPWAVNLRGIWGGVVVAVRAIVGPLSLLIVRLSHDNVMLATSRPAGQAQKDVAHLCVLLGK